MRKKVHMMNFGEEKASKIAEIMSNKTCKKILDYLKDKEGSETDISKELKLPPSTVNYNIGKLFENKLIEVKEEYWSEKGNKVKVYKASDKTFVFTNKKTPILESKLALIFSLAMVVGLLFVINISFFSEEIYQDKILLRFESGEDLVEAFEKARGSERVFSTGGFFSDLARGAGEGMEFATADVSSKSGDFSGTNIQVEGVDEADFVKTDGEYIYMISKGNLIIAKAYPGEEAEVISKTELREFRPNELFIHEDRLLVFGNERVYAAVADIAVREVEYRRGQNMVGMKLYDMSDKEKLVLLKEVSIEGNYLTSRKIEEDVYFVVNSYPYNYREDILCDDLIPLLKEDRVVKPIVGCTDIGYIPDVEARNFLTIASISMENENKEIEKEVIAGNGQNVYASLENLYIAQTTSERTKVGDLFEHNEKTVVTKFELDQGEIEFVGKGEVRGHILNQFSMDEHKGNFRIATTSGNFFGGESSNNVYVLDKDMVLKGELEDLAPEEKIYSVRFMGDRGYVVTFKKVDPLFVIDLEDAENPNVLGKLKIPGYSDYLHPYDENHLIGIGKDTVEAEENLKTGRGLDFAWYQGIKMAVFDVSDVNNPIELHKVIIGDRGTDSEALRDHKAFLFERDKNLLVLPITLAEIKGEKTSDNQYGEFTFQGAHVYDLTLDKGFELRGKITHYEDEEVFKKSGFYFRGEEGIRRSLYIDNILYTISNGKIKLNSLADLKEIKELEF